jgi:hypothetical protein
MVFVTCEVKFMFYSNYGIQYAMLSYDINRARGRDKIYRVYDKFEELQICPSLQYMKGSTLRE